MQLSCILLLATKLHLCQHTFDELFRLDSGCAHTTRQPLWRGTPDGASSGGCDDD